MKKQFYILGLALLILLALVFVDRVIFMKKRVLRYYSWENTGGERIRGNFIDTANVTFKRDTMIFDREIRYQRIPIEETVILTGKTGLPDVKIRNILSKKEPYQDEDITICYDTVVHEYGGKGMDTLILKYQYFSTMKVIDPKTGKAGKYSMKGASWVDYLFRKRK